MLILSDGQTKGTVGGGALEADVMTCAETVFKTARPLCGTFLLTNEQASEAGMICGGKVEILIQYMDASDVSLRKRFQTVLGLLESAKLVALITSLSDRCGHVQTGLGFMGKGVFEPGSLDMSGIDQSVLQSRIDDTVPTLLGEEPHRYFIQPLHSPHKVYIFGAGHIGNALAPICAQVGFLPVILDDRKSFANQDRFPEAVDIQVLDTYADAFKHICIDEGSYLVIVTRGHIHDQTVLSQALRTKAKYIGMIGSRKKRDIIYAALRDCGCSQKDLSRVHCPIGLSIGAETPSEIAVSILAEMIAVRAGHSI
jgi:xanthine dehydrogenase accessory factor